MVRTEEHTRCGCCGAPVIAVPNDMTVTFAGTIHECKGHIRVNNSFSEPEKPKEKNRSISYPKKPDKYVWRERAKRGK